jgi:AcrR family transcriptional regulator
MNVHSCGEYNTTTTAEARQQQIIDAAAACFARRGFHQTTMQDICKEARLSPGSVYRYFRSKEDIIAAMVEEELNESVALLEAVRQSDDAIDDLQKLTHDALVYLNEPDVPTLHVELNAEAARNPQVAELVRRSDQMSVEALAETIRQAQARQLIDPALDSHAAAEVLISLIDGLTMRKSLFPDKDATAYVSIAQLLIARFLRAEREDA